MSYKINSFISSDKVVASYEKRLSICLGSNGFSFSVCSTSDELLALGDVQCNVKASIPELMMTVKSAFAELRLQTFGLKECELVVFSRQFVWIPEQLYDEKRQRDYLEALGHVGAGNGIFSDYNNVIKAWMVFSTDNNPVSAFKIVCPGLKIRCQHSKMVNTSLIEGSDLKSLLLINVREGVADYAVYCNKKLQLSNSFDCTNIDEVIFHAINLTKQFHLEDSMFTVALCGDIDKECYSRVRPFFPNVSLYNGRPLTLTTPEMARVHLCRYAMLF